MSDKISIPQAHCNVCGGDRNHLVLHCEAELFSDDFGAYNSAEKYEPLKCAGCNSIKLRHSAHYPNSPNEYVTYFPPAVYRRRPEWVINLEDTISDENFFVLELHNEIYVALQNNLVRVAAMGIRALLEQIMITKVGDKNSFLANVSAFEKEGHISTYQKERLTAILEAGHAAIHRKYRPSTEDIITLIDITEHIIESVYLHDEKVK